MKRSLLVPPAACLVPGWPMPSRPTRIARPRGRLRAHHEYDGLGALVAEHVEERLEALGRAAAAHVQRAMMPVVDLIDEREVQHLRPARKKPDQRVGPLHLAPTPRSFSTFAPTNPAEEPEKDS